MHVQINLRTHHPFFSCLSKPYPGPKSDGGGDSRVMMGYWLVKGQFFDPNVIRDTVGELSSRVVDWRNENVMVPVLCKIIQKYI